MWESKLNKENRDGTVPNGFRLNFTQGCKMSKIRLLQQYFKMSGFKRVQIPIWQVDKTKKNPSITTTKLNK
uniref:Uncharacterized protein n=1 Tax=Glossina pallidipes TaxID=7398 RepID=A0A1A9ZHY8_GLOPL